MLLLPIIMAANLAWPMPATSRTTSTIPAEIQSIVIENAVLAELNKARTDPAAFARTLRDAREYYHGTLLARPGSGVTYLTQEGIGPVTEAIAYVGRKTPLGALSPASVLSAAAADHQAEQQLDGSVGHVGTDGSTPADRVQRHGGDIYVGELITYGSTDPADIVRQLVVDDGVADRGHRQLLFDGSLRYAGIACGGHPVYRYMCVLTVGRTPDGQPLRRFADSRHRSAS